MKLYTIAKSFAEFNVVKCDEAVVVKVEESLKIDGLLKRSQHMVNVDMMPHRAMIAFLVPQLLTLAIRKLN